MEKLGKWLGLVSLAFLAETPAFAQVGDNYVEGSIAQYSSISSGLLVMMNGALIPNNCTGGSPYGWLLVQEVNKTMVATTLMAITLNKSVTVYTTGTLSGGFCVVNQVQPNL